MNKKNIKNNKVGFSLNMRVTLILMAIVPMVIATLVLSIVITNISSKELKEQVHNSLVEVIDGLGTSFDATVADNQTIMRAYASSPVIMEYLKNPNDAALAEKAENYTLDFFSQIKGFEGIYLADWDTKVMTHPSQGAVGMVLREGDSLEGLRKSMLAAKDTESGVFNSGIMTSPASGQLIMSMYYPIFDGDTPVGFIGSGTYVNDIAEKFSDVSDLGLSSAYVYFVDRDGVMLYHPNPEKIGSPVENEAVKGLVAKIAAGEHPAPECVEYKYKGSLKYAAYYIDDASNYIAVVTADESDALAAVKIVVRTVVVIAVICLILCIAAALYVAKVIATPLAKIAEATTQLSTGDVTVTCDASSSIKETVDIIDAFAALRGALQDSIGNVKASATSLDKAIGTVDDKTSHNVDSVSQISVAIDEVAATSQAVAENAQSMADRAVELGLNVESLTENVSRLHEASITIKEANSDATECMKSVLAGSDKSVEAIQTISSKIAETNDAIVNISNAVQAIEAIATQTNLLSLNASIEAARAGEAGRGFAVVADEIRTLADQSAASAKEIKKTVDDIIALSNETVGVSEEVFEIINAEKADIITTQERFTVLSASVDSSIVEIETINEMTKALDTIKTELANATTDLGAISEELGASAQEVAASCQTVSAACTDTQSSTEEMGAINESMVAAVGFFKID